MRAFEVFSGSESAAVTDGLRFPDERDSTPGMVLLANVPDDFAASIYPLLITGIPILAIDSTQARELLGMGGLLVLAEAGWGGLLAEAERLRRDAGAYEAIVRRGRAQARRMERVLFPRPEAIRRPGERAEDPAAELLIRDGGLGDLLLMTPALAQLRRERPDVDFTLVCLARNAPIFEELELVDRVVETSQREFVPRIPRKFDVVRDLRGGLERHHAAETRHRVYLWGDLLGVDLPPATDPRLRLLYRVSEEEREGARARLVSVVEGRRGLIGIQARSSSPVRWYPYWRDLVRLLAADGWAVAYFHDDRLQGPAGRSIANFSGRVTLRQTAALMEQCDAFVAPDSGLYHLAGALGLPLLGIFNEVDPEFRKPLGGTPNVNLMTRVMCPLRVMPCGYATDPVCRTLPCMRYDVERVRDLAEALAEALPAARRLRTTLGEDHPAPFVARPPAPARSSRLSLVVPRTPTRPYLDLGRFLIRAHLDVLTGYGQLVVSAARALRRRGINVSLLPIERWEQWGHTLPPDIEELVITDPSGFGWELLLAPPHHAGLPRHHTVHFTLWETTRLPAGAAARLNRCAAVITASEWCQTTFDAAGVRVPIFRVPLGIDTTLFHPQPAQDGFCTFGAGGRVAHGGLRKGIYQVYEAFAEAFPREEDVQLRLKVFPDCALPEIGDPRVTVIREAWSDAQMAGFYGDLTAFVSMAYSEGFGLMPLQAMACGRPVIAVNAHGHREYLSEKVGYEVSYTLGRAEELMPGNPHYEGYWYVPDRQSVVERMREVHAEREIARAKGEAAAEVAAAFTWERFCDGLLAALEQVNG